MTSLHSYIELIFLESSPKGRRIVSVPSPSSSRTERDRFILLDDLDYYNVQDLQELVRRLNRLVAAAQLRAVDTHHGKELAGLARKARVEVSRPAYQAWKR